MNLSGFIPRLRFSKYSVLRTVEYSQLTCIINNHGNMGALRGWGTIVIQTLTLPTPPVKIKIFAFVSVPFVLQK